MQKGSRYNNSDSMYVQLNFNTKNKLANTRKYVNNITIRQAETTLWNWVMIP